MNDNATTLAKLLERTETYSESTIELFKLIAIDKTADLLSSFVARLAWILPVALAFILVTTGLALWVGNILGAAAYGFFAVGGGYAVLGLSIQIFRKRWVKLPISNAIIKELLKKDAET